jgi:hypothetical protein
MVEAEQVQNGGVQIVHVNVMIGASEAEIVRRSVANAPLMPAAASNTEKPYEL